VATYLTIAERRVDELQAALVVATLYDPTGERDDVR
jgi:hypothetical protein